MMAPKLPGRLRAQELDRPVAQVARVLGVEGDRVGAAQLVAQVLVDQRGLEAQLARGGRSGRSLTMRPNSISPRRRWPCGSRVHLAVAAQLCRRSMASAGPSRRWPRSGPRPGRRRRSAIAGWRRLMIAPRRMSHSSSSVTGRPRNSSGMMVSVAAAALPMPRARWPAARPMLTIRYQREVVRASSARLRTMQHAQVPGRLEAEGRRRAGQRQVVVDGLGHVGHADGAAALACRPGWPNRPCRRRRWSPGRRRPGGARRRGRCAMSSGDLVGLVREVPRMEPPRRWMPLDVVDGQAATVLGRRPGPAT